MPAAPLSRGIFMALPTILSLRELWWVSIALLDGCPKASLQVRQVSVQLVQGALSIYKVG